MEAARGVLWTYRGKNIWDESPGVPSEVISEDFEDLYDGDLDHDDWALAEPESTRNVISSGRSRDIHESSRCIMQARQDSGVEAPPIFVAVAI